MNAALHKKVFTPAEANQTLPLVKVIVGDIVTLYKSVHDRQGRLAIIRQRPGMENRDDSNVYGEELRQIEEELNRDIERLEEYLEELKSIGVELKDPVKGLIDFNTIIDGREAYLCWQLGEEEVLYWHELDSGFQGRQSILELSEEKPEE
jgi:hypothetical protein